jgi:hypothetical protein
VIELTEEAGIALLTFSLEPNKSWLVMPRHGWYCIVGPISYTFIYSGVLGSIQIMSSTLAIQQRSDFRESGYSKLIDRSPPISDLFKALSDDKSLTIFNTVALSAGKTDMLISTLGVTRKQFYSKVERLITHGLLVRRKGRYYITTLGKVLYEIQSILGGALNDYWKLKAIDSMQIPTGLPEHELNKLIDSLLESTVLKNIILGKGIVGANC